MRPLHAFSASGRLLSSAGGFRPGRGQRRWRRMRARLGLFAVWVAIAFWSMGASIDPPRTVAASVQVASIDASPANDDGHDDADAMLAPSIDTEGALAEGDGSPPAVDAGSR